MKHLLVIFILLFSILIFSLNSHAKWTLVDETEDQFGGWRKSYVDLDNIRIYDGYTYFWALTDMEIPNRIDGSLSFKYYYESDCNIFKYKIMTYYSHREQMGKGRGEPPAPAFKSKWKYPPPDAEMYKILKKVCDD